MKFKKKPEIVNAEQFLPPTKIPKGVFNVYGVGETFIGEVITIHGDRTTVRSGDWIIEEPDGIHYYPVKPDIFEKNYEKVEEPKPELRLPCPCPCHSDSNIIHFHACCDNGYLRNYSEDEPTTNEC